MSKNAPSSWKYRIQKTQFFRTPISAMKYNMSKISVLQIVNEK